MPSFRSLGRSRRISRSANLLGADPKMTTPPRRTVGRDSRYRDEESMVDLRCSVIVTRGEQFLLIERAAVGDWVLPGGRPRPGESMHSCAGREAYEETGLNVNPTRCAFIGEVIDPHTKGRMVELFFLAELSSSDRQAPTTGEPGSRPVWVAVADLPTLALRPPIAGHLPKLLRSERTTAPYLGNLWRPRDPETRSL